MKYSAHDKSLLRRDVDIAELLEVIKFYYPIVTKAICQHDDSSWCNEYCGDGGKKALKILRKHGYGDQVNADTPDL